MRNEVQLDELMDLAENDTDTDPLLEERIQRLVASLPEKPRMIIVLHYGEDMDPEEIGEALDMPVRTVRSHLQRGLALLREKASRLLREKTNEPV
jgi:RNA polymerase sigma-70 factor (ECF subfamily)